MIHFRPANQEPYENNNENFIHLEERALYISFRWRMFSQTTNIKIQRYILECFMLRVILDVTHYVIMSERSRLLAFKMNVWD